MHNTKCEDVAQQSCSDKPFCPLMFLSLGTTRKAAGGVNLASHV